MQEVDPRVKMFIVLLLSSASVITQDAAQQIVLLLAAFVLVVLSGVSIYGFLKRVRHFLGLFIVLALVQGLFTKEGEILFRIMLFPVYSGGIAKSISIILRILTVMLSALLLSTSSSTELVAGLASCGIPYEIPFMVFLGLKFVPYLREEIKDSFIAVQLAGADVRRVPLKEKISLFVYILTPAFAAALIRAKKIAFAAESRGFRACEKRSLYKRPKMKAKDWWIFSASVFSGCIFIIYNLWRNI